MASKLGQSGLVAIKNVVQTAKDNPLASIAIGTGVVGISALGTIAAVTKRKKATKKKKSRKTASTRRRTKKRKYKYARTAGKRKDTSTRRIRMTKHGQPYVILKSGKARFISKRSARLSRKRKGGRY